MGQLPQSRGGMCFCPRARRPQSYILITKFSGKAKTMTPWREGPASALEIYFPITHLSR